MSACSCGSPGAHWDYCIIWTHPQGRIDAGNKHKVYDRSAGWRIVESKPKEQ